MLPWFAHAAINALVVAYVCRHVVSLVAFLCVGTLEIHAQQILILRKCRHDSMRQLQMPRHLHGDTVLIIALSSDANDRAPAIQQANLQ